MTNIPTDFSLGLWSEPKEQTIDDLKQQLAECQAKVKAAKREALLEAANQLNPGYGDYEWRWVCDEISSMAKELE